jgi:hypothetical protein
LQLAELGTLARHLAQRNQQRSANGPRHHQRKTGEQLPNVGLQLVILEEHGYRLLPANHCQPWEKFRLHIPWWDGIKITVP